MGYQTWNWLLFLHWRVPVEEVRRLIPPELTIDTFDGTAWIGMIPFHMTGVRPKWLPPVPGASAIHETNIRTYVHYNGTDPGIWFFTLEANSSLAVRAARTLFSLPYCRAEMTVQRAGRQVRYTGRRQWPGEAGAGYAITTEVDEPLTAPNTGPPDDTAIAGTLEHFLIERYLLYSKRADGTLLRGQVHHRPYPLRAARVTEFRDSLLPAVGLHPPGEPEHVVFSEGVRVEIFPIKPVARP